MNTEKLDNTAYILDTLLQKSIAKRDTYLTTLEQFISIKKVMKFLISNYKKQIKDYQQKIPLTFTENGVFEARMEVAGDMIIFNMHSNVFAFDEKHWIWENEYVKNDNANAYCGVINIYNFLSDSFKYKRLGDYGYIVARLFINRQGHYFIEGNPEFGSFNDHFGKNILDISLIREIIQQIIQYSLEVDLLVPPLEDIQLATVEQMLLKMDQPKLDTGKPLGFQPTALSQSHKKI